MESPRSRCRGVASASRRRIAVTTTPLARVTQTRPALLRHRDVPNTDCERRGSAVDPLEGNIPSAAARLGVVPFGEARRLDEQTLVLARADETKPLIRVEPDHLSVHRASPRSKWPRARGPRP